MDMEKELAFLQGLSDRAKIRAATQRELYCNFGGDKHESDSESGFGGHCVRCGKELGSSTIRMMDSFDDYGQQAFWLKMPPTKPKQQRKWKK